MRTQLEVAGAVGFEGDPPPVEAVAIGFDDQPLLGPNEVGDESSDLDVDLWSRDVVPPAEPEEHELELAACAVACQIRSDRKAEGLSLANHMSLLSGRHQML